MATRLAWLKDAQAKDLRLLARAIGASCSGTKLALRSQIESSLAGPFFQPENKHGATKTRINPSHDTVSHAFPPSLISIDMGVKNLAYCHIRPRSQPNAPAAVLLDWQRVDVLNPDASSPDTKYTYHPSTFSQAAYETIYKLLARAQSDTHFVIERQRFRSMGGKGVFEWTLKVNMLEGMLWAVLATLRQKGSWTGKVWGVRAESVDGFWGEGEGQLSGVVIQKSKRKSSIEDEREVASSTVKSSKGRKKAGEKKKGTIEMVRGWLEDRKLETEGEATKTKERYLSKKKTKLDDLADCVAQGMAVLKWGQNRREILTKDVKDIKLEWDI